MLSLFACLFSFFTATAKADSFSLSGPPPLRLAQEEQEEERKRVEEGRAGVPEVENTSPLQIVGVVREGEWLILTLHNTASQQINFFQINTGDHAAISVDLIYKGGEGVNPSANLTYKTHCPPGDGRCTNLSVETIIYTDGMGEGDAQLINDVREGRAADQAHLEEIIPILQRFLDSEDATQTSGLSRLEAEIKALPEPDRGVSLWRAEGRRILPLDRRGYLLTWVRTAGNEQFYDGERNVRRVREMIDEYRRTVANLKKSIEQ